MIIIPREVGPQSRKMYFFLFALMLSAAFGMQSWQMLITNFAVEDAGFNGFQMGLTQSAKELPGLLSFFAIYFLIFAKEHRLANFFVLLIGAGVFFTGFFPSFTGIILTTFIMSTGFHFYETLSQSMILQYFPVKTAPIVLGKMRGLMAMSGIAGALIILFFAKILPYKTSFMIIGVIVMAVALACFKMKPARTDLPIQARKLKFKKEYWLYYVMTVLSGGRRQIFVVFGLLLLVQKFGFSVTQITVIFLINNIVNFILNPYIGKAVHRFGERKMATTEYASVIVIFAVYAFTDSPMVAAVFYILDQFLINFMIAERTFYQKICAPCDISSGTAMGFTLNHIAAVTIPAICGALWLINYQIAFFAGVGIAAVNLVFIQLMDKELHKAACRKESVE